MATINEAPYTMEQMRQRDEEIERQAAERARAEAEARREDRRRLEEDALLGGRPTARLRAVEDRLRDLHLVANWRWVPATALPALAEEPMAAMKEIQAGIREVARQVLAPRIEEAMAERESAEAERQDLIQRLRRQR
jgi:hypothetical protein